MLDKYNCVSVIAVRGLMIPSLHSAHGWFSTITKAGKFQKDPYIYEFIWITWAWIEAVIQLVSEWEWKRRPEYFNGSEK